MLRQFFHSVIHGDPEISDREEHNREQNDIQYNSADAECINT